MLTWWIYGIPYSFTAHGPDEFEKAELLSLDVKLEHATFAVCVSSFGRSQLMRWSRPDHWRKIAIVHCGVDGPFLNTPIQPPPQTPRLVCVGRIDVQKAQIVLVAAARRLRDVGVHCEIVFIGDGQMRPQVEAAIRLAGLQSKITIAGWASGKTGWLVPAGDEVALAEAMREALEAPVEKLAAMGDLGRRHILECHDSLKEAAKLKSLFEGRLSTDTSQLSLRPIECGEVKKRVESSRA
jgi:colanic acid/amylovoran biosynthesis glycosyltransferase